MNRPNSAYSQLYASGGPVDGVTDYTDSAGQPADAPIRQIGLRSGGSAIGGVGMPVMVVSGGYIVSAPVPLEARIPPRQALINLCRAGTNSPYRQFKTSGVAGPGPSTITLQNPLTNHKADVGMIVLELSSPLLTALPQATVEISITGVDHNFAPLEFNEFSGASPGVFEIKTNQSAKGFTIGLIPFRVVQSKPQPTVFSISRLWDYGGGFAAGQTHDLVVNIDGAPDGSQLDVHAITMEHPIGKQTLREIYTQLIG